MLNIHMHNTVYFCSLPISWPSWDQIWANIKAKILPLFCIDTGMRIWVVQLLSHVQFFVNPRIAAHQASLSFTISQSLLKLISIKLMMLSNHLILCYPLLLLPSVNLRIWVFSNELILHIRWPKYWSFRFSISPSNEYSVLISFRIDWFDLAAGATLKSLLQHHSAKASIALTFRLLYDPMSGNV